MFGRQVGITLAASAMGAAFVLGQPANAITNEQLIFLEVRDLPTIENWQQLDLQRVFLRG